MPDPELKPCPFCGSTNVEITLSYGSEYALKVMCGECLANGPEVTPDDGQRIRSTGPKAVAAWNRRHTPTPEPTDA